MKKTTKLNNNLNRKISKNAIVEPIYMTTTYRQDSIEEWGEFLYTWWDNPNFRSLEEKLTFIESGALETIVFPTWMSAITAVITSILEEWDEVICNDNTYIWTNQIFWEFMTTFWVKTNFIDLLDFDALENSISKKTKLIWVETPSNPLLKLYDIKKISKIAKENNIFVCVDSSFLSSLNISPLELWADIVIQTATKYIWWTADTMWWLASSNKKEICEKIRRTRNILWLFPSPLNCWLLERSLKTFYIRMKAIEKNAFYIAKKLEKLDFVESVIYPWLDSFPQSKIAKEQIKWSWGIISVRLKLWYDRIKKWFSKFEIWNPAVSFWWTESLIDFPCYIWGKNLDLNTKEMIWYNLLRLSVWLEDRDDLLDDFINAFQ